jgi:hypothetical protein
MGLVGPGQLLGKSSNLHGEDIAASFCPPGGIRWHKRMRVEGAQQPIRRQVGNFCFNKSESLRCSGDIVESRGNPPVMRKPIEVYVRDYEIRICCQTFGFLKYNPVLSDDGVASKHYIVRGLSDAR